MISEMDACAFPNGSSSPDCFHCAGNGPQDPQRPINLIHHLPPVFNWLYKSARWSTSLHGRNNNRFHCFISCHFSLLPSHLLHRQQQLSSSRIHDHTRWIWNLPAFTHNAEHHLQLRPSKCSSISFNLDLDLLNNFIYCFRLDFRFDSNSSCLLPQFALHPDPRSKHVYPWTLAGLCLEEDKQ